MVTVLITAGILMLALFVFKYYWKDIVNWCKKAIRLASDVIKGVITFTKKAGKVVSYLYRRLKNGKITRATVTTVEEITSDELPKEVAEALGISDEVLVCNDVERELV